MSLADAGAWSAWPTGHEQIHTQTTAVLQLKTRILSKWNLYTSVLFLSPEMMSATFL